MFAKIQNQFDFGDFSPKQSKGKLFKQYGAIRYFQASNLPEEITKLASVINPDSVHWAEIINAKTISPHIDHGITCALNFYVRSDNSITRFWRPKETAKASTFKGQNTSNIFSFDDVEQVGEFKANDGDVYLLDVTCPHSVHLGNGWRTFIQMSWVQAEFNFIKDALVDYYQK